jgi:hypothetical protein
MSASSSVCALACPYVCQFFSLCPCLSLCLSVLQSVSLTSKFVLFVSPKSSVSSIAYSSACQFCSLQGFVPLTSISSTCALCLSQSLQFLPPSVPLPANSSVCLLALSPCLPNLQFVLFVSMPSRFFHRLFLFLSILQSALACLVILLPLPHSCPCANNSDCPSPAVLYLYDWAFFSQSLLPSA